MEYTFSLSRRSLPVRCLCLLLIAVVLFCFFMCPRAGAVVAESAAVAYAGVFVGSVLVAAGVYFANSGDMARAGAAMYKTLQKGNEAIASKIAAISVWAVDHGKAIGSAALRVGKDLYQGIVDAFNSAYSGGKLDISPSVAAVQDFISSNRSAKTFYIHTYYFDDDDDKYDLGRGLRWYKVDCSVDRTSVLVNVRDLLSNYPVGGFSSGVNGVITSCFLETKKSGDYTYLAYRVIGTYSDGESFDKLESFNPYIRDDCYDLSTSAPVSVPCSGDLAYPSDNSLVRMPDIPSVDTATGEVTYPSDMAYTKDAVAVPYPVDAEGVKVPDIPYDKVVDKSTGKTLDDTDTGTDTKPGTGTETGSGVSGLIGTIIGLLKNFFDSPSDFKLDMDGFRNLAIKDKFPFCIPFDMVDSVKQFAADAADYQFRVKLDTQYFKVDHVVDLTPLAVPLAFFRYLVVAWFAWVLMSRTHDLMKW